MPISHSECQTKINQLRSLLDQHNVDAVLLRKVSSFAWATCGAASYVNTATTEGAASLLITRERLFLITNNIEAPRLEQEEKLVDQGWEFHISPWHTPLAALQTLTSNLSLVSDVSFPGSKDISKEISIMRSHLTPEEGDRFQALGHACAEAITAAAHKIHPGMSELQMAGLLGLESQQRGIHPIVNLIATDDRAYRYRHPLPTTKLLDKYAMLILSGRRKGLVCSITRLVYFGPLTEDLRNRIMAAAQVNATLIAHTRPGQMLCDILEQGQQAYANVGFPEEWRHHHQGGITGYEPREYLATPASTETIAIGQALAWNPTIAGAKIEDTILVAEQSNEIITSTPLWPTISLEIPGQPGTVLCAQALEL
jgi:Xaa-Pro aminopeptidase